MARGGRNVSVDFWRGAAIVSIMVAHVPGNLLEFLTPRNFGFSDSAEAFVFLSGLSIGASCYATALKSGMREVAWACCKRAARIYAVHLAVTAVALTIFGLGYVLFGLPELVQAHGRGILMQDPVRGAIGILSLGHQPGYFNILPLYVLLVLWTPALIAMARASPAFALLICVCIYAATRLLALNLPNWPETGGWFFNPFAWQLVFALGVVAAIRWREDALPRWPALRALSVIVVALGAAVMTDAAGLLPGLRFTTFAHLDLGKQNLGLLRLAHFLALAYAIATTPRLMPLVRGAAGQALQRLGRHGLAVFGLGSVLSALGQAILIIVGGHASHAITLAAGFTYTLAAIYALFAFARILDRGKRTALALSPGRT